MNPDHPITTAKNPRRVRAYVDGHVIADTDDAVTLREADRAPVQYFPRKDVETGFLSETAHVTHCPHKGAATHYTLRIHADILEDAAWSYRHPNPGMAAIGDRIAFYPDKVEIYEVDEEALEHHRREEPRTPGEALERGFITP